VRSTLRTWRNAETPTRRGVIRLCAGRTPHTRTPHPPSGQPNHPSAELPARERIPKRRIIQLPAERVGAYARGTRAVR